MFSIFTHFSYQPHITIINDIIQDNGINHISNFIMIFQSPIILHKNQILQLLVLKSASLRMNLRKHCNSIVCRPKTAPAPIPTVIVLLSPVIDKYQHAFLCKCHFGLNYSQCTGPVLSCFWNLTFYLFRRMCNEVWAVDCIVTGGMINMSWTNYSRNLNCRVKAHVWL